VLHDFKYALRLWASRPWQTIFAVAALAIGIGANTGVFSVVDALLLRTLPFREPDRLVVIQQFIPPHDSENQFHHWRQNGTYLSDAALFEEGEVNLSGAPIAMRAHVAQTSWNFFSVLGTKLVLGSGFTPDADVDGTGWGLPGRNAVAVIGYGLWQQLFGGDSKIIGRAIRMDGIALTIVGVAPPGFDYPRKSVLWKPAAYSPGNNGWTTVARLKPGISWQQARAVFALDVQRFSPESNKTNLRPQLTSLQDALAGPVKTASLILMAASLLILLMGITNVANLLIARTTARATEISIRSALGASRARIAQQLLTESLLLAMMASVVGLLIAYWTTSLATNVEPPPIDAQSYSVLNARVLAFALAISTATAAILGLLPFFYTRRSAGLRMHGSTACQSRLPVQILMAAQVTLTIILLAGSLCVGRAFFQLMRMDRGYETGGIATASISLDGTIHQIENRQRAYFEEVLDRLRRQPGVRSASATEFLPLYASAFVGGPFGIDGRPAQRNSTMIPVLADYFQTMGAQILYGREFTEAEVRTGARVAVVNEGFAREFGSPQDALDHQLTIEGEAARRIIGVVKAMEYETDPSLAHGNQVFIPSSTPGSFFSTFVVRVDGRAQNRLAVVRDTIKSVDPQVPVFGVKTMEQRLNEMFAVPKFYRTVIWTFAGFALMLALIGIFGIVSFAVAQRTKELGIRIALGRTPMQLRGMLLQQGLLLVMLGAVPGIVGAHVTGRYLQSLINGARPVGLAASSSLVVLFGAVAAASIWSATRRISTLDVISILRDEPWS
jgi:putative ABC transport system permease protein